MILIQLKEMFLVIFICNVEFDMRKSSDGPKNEIQGTYCETEARVKHLIALNNIKGQVDNKSPVRPKFLSLHQKTQQLRSCIRNVNLEKDSGIHYENGILIDRMITAKSSVPPIKLQVKTSSKSLSRSYRKKV